MVIQNVMECTALKHGPGELEARMVWALECVHLAAKWSPACLETALGTLRLVVSTLISHSAAVEETCYCLFHAMKCSFDLTRGESPPSQTALSSLAYAHVV